MGVTDSSSEATIGATFLVVGTADVGHEDGTTAALDDVVQRGDGGVHAEGVGHRAALHAVVVHANQNHLAVEVGVLHAAERATGKGRSVGHLESRASMRPRGREGGMLRATRKGAVSGRTSGLEPAPSRGRARSCREA